MSFAWSEIVTGMVSAAIYGSLFAFVVCFVRTCIAMADDILKGIRAVFLYKGNAFDVSEFTSAARVHKTVDGEIIRAFWVILYTLGFFVASYIGFDGEIRLYMLLISICSFYIIKTLVGITIEKLIFVIIRLVLRLFVPLTRILFYPLRAIFLFAAGKLKKIPHYEDI